MKTNFDKIKSMTVDELAWFLDTTATCQRCIYRMQKDCCQNSCQEGIKQWLLKENEDE